MNFDTAFCMFLCAAMLSTVLIFGIVAHTDTVRTEQANACAVDMVRAGADPAKARDACR